MITNLKRFKKQLNEIVIGQIDGVEQVTTLIFKYFIKYISKDYGYHFNCPSVMLLMGSTGVGKTFLVKQAAELVNLPLLEINSKTLGLGGSWHGDSLDKQILAWRQKTNVNKGIIFIDEFDKIVSPARSSDGDDVHYNIQTSLLKEIEKIVHPPLNTESLNHNTQFIFILAGAFSQLKLEKKLIGYHALSETDSLFDALLNYGLIPELAGRIQEYCILKDLTRNDYKEILNSDLFNLALWEGILKYMDTDLNWNEKDLLDYACSVKLGGRGLIQAVEKHVTKIMNENSDNIDLSKFLPL